MKVMDSLFNILSDKDFDEPSEIKAIKLYVKKRFNADVGVKIRDRDIVVLVSSAALANTLRLDGPAMKRYCGIEKRISFRIGH
jgi:hypothetical protein